MQDYWSFEIKLNAFSIIVWLGEMGPGVECGGLNDMCLILIKYWILVSQLVPLWAGLEDISFLE